MTSVRREILKRVLGIFFIPFLTLVQMTPLLDFNLIKPNLILIGFAVLIIFFESARILIFNLAAVGFIFVIFGFWTQEWIFLIFLVVGGFFLNRFLKGRRFLNFLILIFLLSLVFHLLNSFHFAPVVPVADLPFLIAELILNFGWGLIFYILMEAVCRADNSMIKYHEK